MLKRIIAICFAAAVCAIALTGCSSEKSIDANALAKDLLENGTYAEALSEVKAEITEKRYAIAEGEVEETIAYAGTNAVVDEIAVFKVKGDIDAVAEKAAAHIDTQTETYKSYRPSELPKLSDCIVTTAGDCVIVCVSEDAEKAREIVNSYMK